MTSAAAGSFGSVQRRQLVDEVIRSLRAGIASGGFPIGSKLPPEPILMEQLGVGRSTIREAVRVLAHAGLLDVRQGDGTYVRSNRDQASLTNRLRDAVTGDVHEVRRALEMENARLASSRRDDDNIALMNLSLARREKARLNRDTGALVDADIEFHMAIAAATKNSLLTEMYADFVDALRASLSGYATLSATQAALHSDLLNAIEKRDADAAVAVTGMILDRAGQEP